MYQLKLITATIIFTRHTLLILFGLLLYSLYIYLCTRICKKSNKKALHLQGTKTILSMRMTVIVIYFYSLAYN